MGSSRASKDLSYKRLGRKIFSKSKDLMSTVISKGMIRSNENKIITKQTVNRLRKKNPGIQHYSKGYGKKYDKTYKEIKKARKWK